MAQNINDFYIQLAKNAQTRQVKKYVDVLNQGLSRTNFGEAVTFFGPSTRDVLITDVLRRGSIFAVRPIEGTAFGGAAGWHADKLDPDELKILKEQKIKNVNRLGIPNDLYGYSQGIFINAEGLERKPTISSLGTVYHELGHAASSASGAKGQTDLLLDEGYSQLYQSKGLTVGKVRDLTTNILRSFSLEEGRAEQFALELIQRNHIASGKSSAEDILSNVHLAYLDPKHFDGYLSYFNDAIETGLSRVDGLDQTLIPKLAEDIKLDAKASAIGDMHGHFRMISGEFGPLVEQKANTTINESFKNIYNSINLNDERSDYLAQRIREASDKVVSEGRRTVFGEPLQDIQVTFAQSGRAVAALPRNASVRVAPAAKSSSLVQAAQDAAQAVVNRDSAAMRIAGAAATIFRRRI